MRSSLHTSIALLVSCALAQNSCYYGVNLRAGSAIIPCGASDVQSSCCQLGDLCLSDSACWNPDTNVTYLYGCTDSSYQDPTCPWKCGNDFADAPYVGLDYCSNTTSNEWSCTHPPSNSEAIQAFGEQQCYDDSIIAFAGPSVLQPILSLPSVVGEGTVWFSQINPTSWLANPDYTPTSTSIQVTASVPTTVELVSTSSTTTTSDSSSSSSSSINTTTGSAAAGQTSASQTSESPSSETGAGSSGLSDSAKIGIGVGVGVGGVGLGALIAAFIIVRRRRTTHRPVSQKDDHSDSAYPRDSKGPDGPAELPGGPAKYDRTSANFGNGFGHNSSTMSNYSSPVPTYSSSAANDLPPGPRPTGHDRVHELGS